MVFIESRSRGNGVILYQVAGDSSSAMHVFEIFKGSNQLRIRTGRQK